MHVDVERQHNHSAFSVAKTEFETETTETIQKGSVSRLLDSEKQTKRKGETCSTNDNGMERERETTPPFVFTLVAKSRLLGSAADSFLLAVRLFVLLRRIR